MKKLHLVDGTWVPFRMSAIVREGVGEGSLWAEPGS